MTVRELIDILSKIEDKSLDVGVETDGANLWVYDVQVNNAGTIGYENFGSVELKVSE